MENLSGISGYVASMLVLLTFVAKDMRLLRATAIFSNVAFITYGAIVWLPPALLLHLVLLPLASNAGVRINRALARLKAALPQLVDAADRLAIPGPGARL